jgi:predicted dehydrogenase
MKEPRPLNVAVVGLGFMGVTHLKAYQKTQGARLAAVCDAVRKPDAEGYLGGVGGNVGTDDGVRLHMNQTRYYGKFEDVLADAEIDLVDICLPTAAHTTCSLQALQAGKHVICEKPLARTSAEARRIVAAVDAASTFFLPAMCMRFWPGWDWLRTTIETATYGRTLAARFRRVSSPPATFTTWTLFNTVLDAPPPCMPKASAASAEPSITSWLNTSSPRARPFQPRAAGSWEKASGSAWPSP